MFTRNLKEEENSMVNLTLEMDGLRLYRGDISFEDRSVILLLVTSEASHLLDSLLVKLDVGAETDSVSLLRLGQYTIIGGAELLPVRMKEPIPNNLPYGPTQEDLDNLGITFTWQGIQFLQQRGGEAKMVDAQAIYALESFLQLRGFLNPVEFDLEPYRSKLIQPD